MKNLQFKPKYEVEAESVFQELRKHMLVDGFDFVLDLGNSTNPYFTDAISGRKFKDFFTCFASLPLGLNHPKVLDESFLNYLTEVAINKPSNSDLYTSEMATFVKTFRKVAAPAGFEHYFFISGGALAVENALKTAFDWKVRKNFRKGYREEKGHQVIHFRQAFHGRSGYTMSLTNTEPAKTMYYPKFKWPRITNPKIEFPLDEKNLEKVLKLEEIALYEIKQAFLNNPDDIAAIIIEPIQGEGGDNHFRTEFLKKLKELAVENDVLLIFDEVQTGVGITGTMWAFEQLDVVPDILVFGKKMQICGIVAGPKIDEIPDNVFKVSSRINSTWGGSLVDMVRAERYLEIIEEDNLLDNVKSTGKLLESKISELVNKHYEYLFNARGRGLMCAFDVVNSDLRNKFKQNCFNEGLLILPCGEKSIRFRPPLNLNEEHLEEGFSIIESAAEHTFC
ncbi:MAG: L-lysine 6-transaminase [Ignavibacteria bacterium GWB2_35_12]|nr:MAG: L-lysine 6-transaminase [Ignavibacteria bacterium GWA2_35_8]OGU40056.1 MAG: L-lysine 6-transaminase [Ignavibacteria bacterium GWB2_35_12]OGU93999.1 MAG: L-lysine 6-transaminase [Ignavibacteria bacterium RIFOXYA2_FULL_35_10]OGV22856.1 MAG: L-lysine 6-transaminase [Ignavibacteria bacterium RIFOXYC2_FULL_35_21]